MRFATPSFIAACAAFLSLGSAAAEPSRAPRAEVPPSLAVPGGNRLAFALEAEGPPDGCDAAHAGAIARVPYRAVYSFYRSEAGRSW